MSTAQCPPHPVPPAGAATEAAAVQYLKQLPTATIRDGRRHLADHILAADLSDQPREATRAHRAALGMFDRELAARAPGEKIGAHAEAPLPDAVTSEELLADSMEGGPGGRRFLFPLSSGGTEL